MTNLRRVTNQIGPNLTRKSRLLDDVPKDAYNEFKNVTPKLTGNAKQKTDFKEKAFGGSIEGNYPYVNRLNEGYSRQAPEGMTDPTIDSIRANIRNILG
jgi:hypothetical protein